VKNDKGSPATSCPQKLREESLRSISRNLPSRPLQDVHFGPRLLDLNRSANYLRALGTSCLHAADTKRPEEILAAFTILRTLRLSELEVRP
jgi:hypothetical protein